MVATLIILILKRNTNERTTLANNIIRAIKWVERAIRLVYIISQIIMSGVFLR